MPVWREKANYMIAKLSLGAYKRENPVPGKKHKPYAIPELAADLVVCLDDNDEVRAKSLFLSYDGLKALT